MNAMTLTFGDCALEAEFRAYFSARWAYADGTLALVSLGAFYWHTRRVVSQLAGPSMEHWVLLLSGLARALPLLGRLAATVQHKQYERMRTGVMLSARVLRLLPHLFIHPYESHVGCGMLRSIWMVLAVLGPGSFPWFYSLPFREHLAMMAATTVATVWLVAGRGGVCESLDTFVQALDARAGCSAGPAATVAAAAAGAGADSSAGPAAAVAAAAAGAGADSSANAECRAVAGELVRAEAVLALLPVFDNVFGYGMLYPGWVRFLSDSSGGTDGPLALGIREPPLAGVCSSVVLFCYVLTAAASSMLLYYVELQLRRSFLLSRGLPVGQIVALQPGYMGLLRFAALMLAYSLCGF